MTKKISYGKAVKFPKLRVSSKPSRQSADKVARESLGRVNAFAKKVKI